MPWNVAVQIGGGGGLVGRKITGKSRNLVKNFFISVNIKNFKKRSDI